MIDIDPDKSRPDADEHDDPTPIFTWGNAGPGCLVYEDAGGWVSDCGYTDDVYGWGWLRCDSLDELKAIYLKDHQSHWDAMRKTEEQERELKARRRAAKAKKPTAKSTTKRAAR
jgi:hypothetical protein